MLQWNPVKISWEQHCRVKFPNSRTKWYNIILRPGTKLYYTIIRPGKVRFPNSQTYWDPPPPGSGTTWPVVAPWRWPWLWDLNINKTHKIKNQARALSRTIMLCTLTRDCGGHVDNRRLLQTTVYASLRCDPDCSKRLSYSMWQLSRSWNGDSDSQAYSRLMEWWIFSILQTK